MASLSDDVLRLIAMNRNFIRNYTVIRNLVSNPKTPLDVSLHLLPNITSTDLKTLTLNKNIPDTLRTAAVRLNRQRIEAGKDSVRKTELATIMDRSVTSGVRLRQRLKKILVWH
jgi:hypothetical protein